MHPGEPANDPAPAALARQFAESSLLVLDNCEQVVDGCAELVISLLGATQSLRVIAASRQPLGVPGEQVWAVPGLPVHEPLPGGGRSGRVEDLAETAHILLALPACTCRTFLRKLGAKRRVDAAGLAHALGLLATG
ncbi:MAG: hypothetical protein WBP81_38285 [Solirubrobacteraceae bacterium]